MPMRHRPLPPCCGQEPEYRERRIGGHIYHSYVCPVCHKSSICKYQSAGHNSKHAARNAWRYGHGQVRREGM